MSYRAGDDDFLQEGKETEMGFDLYGVNGQYFRASIWSWHAIVSLICETDVLPKDYPDIVCIASNNGYRVVGALAGAIADALDSRLAELPGIEKFTLDSGDGPYVDENGCFTDVPGLPAYQVDREMIQEFIAFCRSCTDGGFEIW